MMHTKKSIKTTCKFYRSIDTLRDTFFAPLQGANRGNDCGRVPSRPIRLPLPITMAPIQETSSTGEPTTQMISKLYRMMHAVENNIGGGEGVEGLYGSITGASMERVLRSMEISTGLSSMATNDVGKSCPSVLMDVGSGLCRPLVHALATGRVSSCTGVEVDRIKCIKADAFCRQVKRQITRKEINVKSNWDIDIVCSGIEALPTINPVTHVYSFWEGVPVDARVGLAKLFKQSRTATSICVVQRAIRHDNPAEYMDEAYGFGPLRVVDSFRVAMSGSGRSFMAYVFVKEGSHNIIQSMFSGSGATTQLQRAPSRKGDHCFSRAQSKRKTKRQKTT